MKTFNSLIEDCRHVLKEGIDERLSSLQIKNINRALKDNGFDGSVSYETEIDALDTLKATIKSYTDDEYTVEHGTILMSTKSKTRVINCELKVKWSRDKAGDFLCKVEVVSK